MESTIYPQIQTKQQKMNKNYFKKYKKLEKNFESIAQKSVNGCNRMLIEAAYKARIVHSL